MLTLDAQKRKLEEKPEKLREKGYLPAILYGKKIKNIPLKLKLKNFEEIYNEAGETSLISLRIKGDSEGHLVLIHDFQKDPITGKFLHVDFFQPALRKKIEVRVPLVFTGESKAVKDLGGILIKEMSEIEIKGLPQHLPHSIEVDISKLEKIEDTITIKDLKLPENIEVLKKPEEVVASITLPKKEKVKEKIEEKIEGAPSKVPEVKEVKEENKEEEAEEKKQEGKNG